MTDARGPSSSGGNAAETSPSQEPTSHQAPGSAVAALILGIVAIIVPGIGFFAGIAAIILGINALNKIGHEGRQGRGMTVTGIILGILGILLHILIIAFFVAFVKNIMEDPAGTMSKIPGAQGCNVEEPFTCANYTVTDDTITLILSTTETSNIARIEGYAIAGPITNESGMNECGWEGTTSITKGETKPFILNCAQPVPSEAIVTIQITYQDERYSSSQEAAGTIIP